jgi:hypothetical protein
MRRLTHGRLRLQRLGDGRVPQMGHSNERNRYGEITSRATRGAETELVDTPEAAALRQRKINRQSVFVTATIPLGGFDSGGGNAPVPRASETGNMTDNRPVFQDRATDLSGADR